MQAIAELACKTVSAKTQRERGHGVPCPPWWIEDAKKAMGSMTGRALGAKVGASESQISRLLSGKVTTLELIAKVSAELKIKNPFDADTVAAPPKPSPTDTAEEIIRKNLIRAREQAGYDQLAAADATGIPFETLHAYESGTAEIPNAALRTIAPVYGRKPGDFFEVEMPAVDLEGARFVFFRGQREAMQVLSKEDLAKAAALEAELDEKIHAAKRAQLEHFKKAKEKKRR